MAKRYGFKAVTTHQAIIFEKGTEAENDDRHTGDPEGFVVGSSEWGWISEDDGRIYVQHTADLAVLAGSIHI